MSLDKATVSNLYTRRLNVYAAMVSFFRSQDGISAILQCTNVIDNDISVLDAGCGFGLASFALINAMKKKNISYRRLDAFDLTPAMLSRFRKHLSSRPNIRVELEQADVMHLQKLPSTWRDYDLVISTSMLEYLPRQALPHALANLRRRMTSGGSIVIMITRKSIATKLLIEKGWHSERYDLSELRAAFEQAGFTDLRHVPFPLRYGWLNRANYVLVAKCP